MNLPPANSFLSGFSSCPSTYSVVNHHMQDIPTPHSSKNKSDKFSSDRFLPLRRGPATTRELFTSLDGRRDMTERCECPTESQSNHKVKDIYRAEILGENIEQVQKGEFATYSNDNFLRYSIKEQSNQHYELFDKRVIMSQIQPKAKPRIVSKFPYRVLDAPNLLIDLTTNLLDWSNSNIIGVGLSRSMYLWNASSLKTQKLPQDEQKLITSVNFSPSNLLAVGSNDGKISLWDCNRYRKIHSYVGQRDRVGSLSWKNANIVASGSRDCSILIRDIRSPRPVIRVLEDHDDEVCGVKWSHDEQQLASGGTDSKLLIWQMHYPKPLLSFQRHSGAVKALAWSPHQHGLLASGAGPRDSTIRLWNALNGQEMGCFYSGMRSQVSNLIFGKSTNELVSTHGANLNQIGIWSVGNLKPIVTVGDAAGVLFMAMSPDGASVVTAGADESLRFWKLFPPESKQNKTGSKLSNDATSLR